MDTNSYHEAASRHDHHDIVGTSASERYNTSTRSTDRATARNESQLATGVEFGSGWYHAAALKHANKA